VQTSIKSGGHLIEAVSVLVVIVFFTNLACVIDPAVGGARSIVGTFAVSCWVFQSTP
jgi:hypothetical protein